MHILGTQNISTLIYAKLNYMHILGTQNIRLYYMHILGTQIISSKTLLWSYSSY